MTVDFELAINEGYIEEKIKQANTALKKQIAIDCDKFTPFRNGKLRQSVQITDEGLFYPGPYAHYMYMGEKYGHPKSGASGYIGSDGMWHGWKGVKKVPTGQPLHYYTEGTGDHWFDRAYEVYHEEWEKMCGKIISGGVVDG